MITFTIVAAIKKIPSGVKTFVCRVAMCDPSNAQLLARKKGAYRIK